MIKLAYQLLISRKKWLVLLVFILSLVISSVISIFTATDAIKFSLLSRSFEQYGEFSGVVYNVLEKKEDITKKTNVGQFDLIDELSITNNKVATIGWVDQDFIDLGHIKLIAGEFPQNIDEIAIESYYLDSIDPKWKIGESRTIKIKNLSKTLKLVGIVDNYSSRWSVREIVFPNLFVSKSTFPLDALKNNYLIGFNQKLDIEKNINNAQKLVSDYKNDGFINDRLFSNGLKDIKNIMIISYSVQIIILLVSSFSFLCVLSYFNTNQLVKFAVFKALGCTNRKLFRVTILQTAFIYILAIIFSIPLILSLHHQIVKNTYVYGMLENNMNNLFLGVFTWIFLLFILIVLLSYFTIIKYSKSSISSNLKGIKTNSFVSNTKLNKINLFSIKQLMIQLLSHPKNSVLSVITITFSILIILFSYTMAKESSSGWDTKIDYFLSSQELIGVNLVDGKTVVTTKHETFNPLEVREIESLDGVKYINKVPFMLDVVTSVNKKLLTGSLSSYIKNDNSYDGTNEVTLNNVNYVLLNTKEMNDLYASVSKEELKNSIIIYIPNLNNDSKKQLIGEKLALIKTYIDEGLYKTKSWDFKILDVLASPYIIKLDDGNITRDGITVILNEDSVIDRGITQGYKDIEIYIKDNLSKEKSVSIYNKVYALSAGIPGSLFQYVPDLIHDNTRISDYLEFLGKLTFYISITLSISCVYVVIFGKYQSQKRHWGIYRALGLSENKMFLYLLLEVLTYFILSILFSSILYSIFLLAINITYPTMYYIRFAGITTISTFLMLTATAIFMKQKITQDSISSLVRIED